MKINPCLEDLIYRFLDEYGRTNSIDDKYEAEQIIEYLKGNPMRTVHDRIYAFAFDLYNVLWDGLLNEEENMIEEEIKYSG